MINITILCVGRIKEKYYINAVDEYIKRLGAYATVSVTELKEERLPEGASAAQLDAALLKEAEALLLKIPKGAYTVALCVEGKELSSEQLADSLTELTGQSSRLCFIIGSSNGLHDSVKKMAQLRLSLSKMTLPHSLARVVAAEQLYRAFNIASNGKYHK